MRLQKFVSIYHISAVFSLLVLISACEKAVEVGPSSVALNGDNVYTTDGGAQSVVAGLLTRMAGANAFYNGSSSISLTMGLAADELVNYSQSNQVNAAFYSNTWAPNLTPPFWSEIYRELFICNTAIKGISGSSSLTPSVRTQLLGELKFIRAFNFFYAVNLYGDVPLTLTDDYKVNNNIARSPQQQVYDQILKDLKEAMEVLSDGKYVNGSGAAVTERIRPNRQVVAAFLARVYLYLEDWKNAEHQASSVISNANYTLVSALSQVFLKGSREAIWQLQPVSTTYVNTADAAFLVLSSNAFATAGQLPLSDRVTSSFEAGDQRLTSWVGQYTTTTTPAATYNYAWKYKANTLASTAPSTEYPVVMRLAEQYLIRAEARARQNNTDDARADLDAVRERAGLDKTPASDPASLVDAVIRERRVELFSEWGHRWFDLKRTGQLDDVMKIVTPTKGGTWSPFRKFLPVPESDLLANTSLLQTDGY
ncbi:RagB/SusD family nutrient uptake outer membrane protein [Pararcticibacter amylolyticus]|uniref:RagB/SusD family nutrient uptake outer membrane protein n=1 Tax=Pararcticibacter amylolyticus TaxID=2173175 RepID=A0A2U2PA80_9SPHI|nr:RagB/SusD family nutrient uptake outer membrane protein [Pararcticibacter amylolyticus]PWG78306.1 RagB/SusD family nutrient uptake outer membrane protein [Pararcticibacter amylolyticus]